MPSTKLTMIRHVGVDGCAFGWIAVTRSGAGLTYRVLPAIDDVASAFPDAERIFVDIPIGLPWADTPIRPCDRLARTLLGTPRRSSVFPVPCREALAAGDLAAARKLNDFTIGRSLGAQTWGISPKIAEVDRFLLTDRTHCRTVREIHPEVCFWALAGGKPMAHRKTAPEGRAERLRVLESYEPAIALLLEKVLSETRRKHVEADDVLDAAAALVTAEARQGALTSLAGAPTHDPSGLPMEMVYLRLV